ncbi:SDR family oxidoreductase [Plantactinospora sp. KLBMP9567]|uniref:SDR family oxidoreductase n=1 Tax=Plantactinospora sp. KLBMP9567 TaxID=3085900 RepID=UPI0029813777|nr:SDR family oxidoreductase [Plantactinospora sp. KLBMP9567]MDW5329928.1 SDR family oxidoreductase [Plantactinospora sp. KLBMP9567]
MPSLNGAVVLITGANGGLGTHFVHQALERGAAKVYAAARNPRDWNDGRIIPLVLDVTSPESIATAADIANDVTVVINNAGASNGSSVLGDLAAVRELFETNFWGALAVTNAFSPALKTSRGTVLNVLSVLSWLGIGDAYSATKAALWQATNTQRIKLAPAGVHVAGLHLGYADTPMAKRVDAPKLDPADVVRSAYDGIEAGSYEILADELSGQVKAGLAAPIEALYPQLAGARA